MASAETVDIKPSREEGGVYVLYGGATPAWFAHEAQAIGYAEEVFPHATIRIFADDGVIVRMIPPK